jgi:hypothetical protein
MSRCQGWQRATLIGAENVLPHMGFTQHKSHNYWRTFNPVRNFGDFYVFQIPESKKPVA